MSTQNTGKSTNPKRFGRDEGFIVPFLFYLFYFLEYISLFKILRLSSRTMWYIKNRNVPSEKLRNNPTPFFESYLYPEVWAVGHLFLSLFFFHMTSRGYIFQFALIYAISMALDGIISSVTLSQSFSLFMTQSDAIRNGNSFIMIIAQCELVLGIFMNIVCLARFIGTLPDIFSKDKF